MINHVFLTCKNQWICRTVIAKRGLAISVRWQKNHQQIIKNEANIHAKIDETSVLNPCSKKWCLKHGKLLKMKQKKGAKIIKYLWKIQRAKRIDFWRGPGRGDRPWGSLERRRGSTFPGKPGPQAAQIYPLRATCAQGVFGYAEGCLSSTSPLSSSPFSTSPLMSSPS